MNGARSIGWPVFFLLWAGTASLSLADDSSPALPTVHPLSCATPCAQTDPVGVKEPRPTYPAGFTGYEYGGYVEGLVELDYMIGTDGHVGDIMVTHLVGPQKFAQITQDAVKDWIYKPATVDGQPVEKDHTLLMRFRVQNVPQGARPAIHAAYNSAVSLAKEGKFDEARQKLVAAQAEPLLNFYERSYIANMLALLSLQQKDYLEARTLIEIPGFLGATGDLDSSIKSAIYKTRLMADLGIGDVGDAVDTETRLKSMRALDDSDPLVKEVSEMREHADALPVFAVSGEIPTGSEGDTFSIGLYRPSFAFQNISGTLDRLIISCRQRAVESQVSEAAEWHVPKSWTNCRAIVHGSGGTKFQLVQYAN